MNQSYAETGPDPTPIPAYFPVSPAGLKDTRAMAPRPELVGSMPGGGLRALGSLTASSAAAWRSAGRRAMSPSIDNRNAGAAVVSGERTRQRQGDPSSGRGTLDRGVQPRPGAAPHGVRRVRSDGKVIHQAAGHFSAEWLRVMGMHLKQRPLPIAMILSIYSRRYWRSPGIAKSTLP